MKPPQEIPAGLFYSKLCELLGVYNWGLAAGMFFGNWEMRGFEVCLVIFCVGSLKQHGFPGKGLEVS